MAAADADVLCFLSQILVSVPHNIFSGSLFMAASDADVLCFLSRIQQQPADAALFGPQVCQ